MEQKVFKNETQPYTPKKENYDPPNSYGFTKVTPYLLLWSRAFQAVISQVGTYILTGKFHDHECGIYKCEGGCHIAGVGDLVLYDRSCYFDCWPHNNEDIEKKSILMANLITYVVMHWDPNDPKKSMLKAALDHLNSVVVEKSQVTEEDFKKVMDKTTCGGVFGGDSLSRFFNRNPFAEKSVDREYEKFCQIKFGGKTEAEVDQMHADEDLGKDLLEKIQKKYRACNPHEYSVPMCCSPIRGKSGLGFWINTGRFTQIDGWKTQKDIEAYLASDGKLIDDKRI